MKKEILITAGIVLILLVVGIWVYLFMFGAPKNSADVFTQFGFGDTDREILPITPQDTRIDVRDGKDDTPQKLRQLTTRPVAGAAFSGSGIYYVEEGTGHLYYIDLLTGLETLHSGTTILGTYEAVFSSNASFVAIVQNDDGTEKTFLAPISRADTSGSLSGVTLPLGARQVSFVGASNTLMYSLRKDTGTSGYSYDPVTKDGKQVFTIPLRDVKIIWGSTIYAYTTPTALQEGYLYHIDNSRLSYVTKGGRGLSSFTYPGGLVVTTNNDGVLSSYVQNASGTTTNLPLTFIPEKCTSGRTLVYCAVPADFPNPESFPDNWYKGTVSFSDNLWKFDNVTGLSTALSNFLVESGREIDVQKMVINNTDTIVAFINKNDNTLWMFDLTP